MDTETGERKEQRFEHRESAEAFHRDLAGRGAKVRVGMEASGHALFVSPNFSMAGCVPKAERLDKRMRVWQKIRVSSLSRHSHDAAYATVIIAGGYEEAGDQGRFRVQTGEVILHDRFEAHLDRFGRPGAALLNLRLPNERQFSPGAARVADLDLILRTAERSRAEAVEVLLSMIQRPTATIYDWPDALASAFWEDPSLRLLRWAEENELAPWKISRDFRRVYGTSPETFRARVRARRAWKMIRTTTTPLVDIACSLGFADQSHMTRNVKQLSGVTPRALRATANGFKT